MLKLDYFIELELIISEFYDKFFPASIDVIIILMKFCYSKSNYILFPEFPKSLSNLNIKYLKLTYFSAIFWEL